MNIQKDIYVNRLSLKEQIEYFRNEMVCTGLKEGFSSPKTVEISQNLDALLNKLLEISKF
ncbi:aspartyl-phosphate phosphatase Spo0E family protein [Priestia megaterium]|uniref:aspartyl-phosphate phosphatase Spo0E family protein n=1 Tax=Priestia megaterium TaxID=1404 RepID=UPI002E244FD4|nr:aspartyl-phosphate phosphatase Spo0E family protein [Priestia megaterium]